MVGTEFKNSLCTKHIAISSKRQITLPLNFFETLHFGTKAECTMYDDCIVIRPSESENTGFSEQILADLIKQGFSGEKLLSKFKEVSRKVRPAVNRMIAEADKAAKNGQPEKIEDIFAEDSE